MQSSQNKTRGIIIAVPNKYENICLSNVKIIRELRCDLPIEIWEIGDEISQKTRYELSKFENIYFKNVYNYCDDAKHWKGFQIKAFILYYTSFIEVLLFDADILIHQNPELLFDDENYLNTGTYFFKDLEKWQFSNLRNIRTQFTQLIKFDKFTSAVFFKKRKKWLLSILPVKSPFFPKEWDYVYSNKLPDKPVKEALQEAGIVLINKNRHKDSIQNIYNLNYNYRDTYKYIWGDKETFWIGCLMANKPFYFNPSSGYISEQNGNLTHDYGGNIFFSQKG